MRGVRLCVRISHRGRKLTARAERCARMFERRQFVSSCLATALWASAVSAALIREFGLEDRVGAQLDAQFSEAMHQVASVRETNRSTSIVVTYLFQQILDTHNLSEFRDFLTLRYEFKRERDRVAGNLEYTYVNDRTLRALDRRFLSQDRLDLFFRYSATGKKSSNSTLCSEISVGSSSQRESR